MKSCGFLKNISLEEDLSRTCICTLILHGCFLKVYVQLNIESNQWGCRSYLIIICLVCTGSVLGGWWAVWQRQPQTPLTYNYTWLFHLQPQLKPDVLHKAFLSDPHWKWFLLTLKSSKILLNLRALSTTFKSIGL